MGADGRVADLEALTPQDVRTHYEQIVRAGNVVISVTGDFQREAVMEPLQALLEKNLSGEPFVAALPSGPGQVTGYTGHVPMEREQAVVLQAYADCGIQEDDYIVGEVLNELFSGMSSRLFERVREDQGMAYYVGSTRVVGLREGMFVFYAGTQPSQAEAVVQEIDSEIARVAAGE